MIHTDVHKSLVSYENPAEMEDNKENTEKDVEKTVEGKQTSAEPAQADSVPAVMEEDQAHADVVAALLSGGIAEAVIKEVENNSVDLSIAAAQLKLVSTFFLSKHN